MSKKWGIEVWKILEWIERHPKTATVLASFITSVATNAVLLWLGR